MALLACLSAILVAGVVAKSLTESEKKSHRQSSSKSSTKKTAKKKAHPASTPETLKEDVEEFADGKHVKAVWAESAADSPSDPHVKGDQLILAGFDSKAGGYRVLRENPSNYARPLITPDGGSVLYTHKGTQNANGVLSFSPQIHLVNWQTKVDEVLAPGFCVDVALDATTGKTMVYALETLNPKTQPTLDGERLVRFPLDEPQKKEAVWNKTSLSVDNVQFSKDGKLFAGLFPWPEGGVGNVAAGTWQRTINGCWSSMAPDNSYLMWIFAGSHNKVRFVDMRTQKRWEVKFNNHPDFGKAQVYHPRWANHPRFFSLSGPYLSKSAKEKAKASHGSSSIDIEIYMGRFSPNLDRVEAWQQLSFNNHGDCEPDLWIEKGDGEILANFAQTGEMPAARPVVNGWPGQSKALLFSWKDAESQNQIEDRHMDCNIDCRGVGRFSRNKDMLLDGGWFETDVESSGIIASTLAKSKAFSLEMLFIEESAMPKGQSAIIGSLNDSKGRAIFEINRTENEVQINIPDGKFSTEMTVLAAPLNFQSNAGQHLVLTLDEKVLEWSINGKNAVASTPVKLDFEALEGAKLTFGQDVRVPGNWSARLANVALYKRALTEREISQHKETSTTEPLPPGERIRVKATLVEATTPDLAELGSYKRMLVDHTYEVTQVLEGTYTEPRVLVLHWAVLDKELVPGFPRKIGDEFELILEPQDNHPEIESELQMATSSDLGAAVFLEVTSPQPLAKSK